MKRYDAVVGFVGWGAVAAAGSGCGGEDCLSGIDDACIVPSPCDQVLFACDGGSSEVFVHGVAAPPAAGPAVLAAPGDFVLRNDRIVAVLDALDHPHYVAPTGGALLDLAVRGGAPPSAPLDAAGQDGLRNLFQAAGLLPGDAVNYTDARMLADGAAKAVQYRGTLVGHPDIHVSTRYEIRPCEDGVRIRTEIVNREPDPYPLFLVDAFYWGDRQYQPFTPGPEGGGFAHPAFGLTTITDALRDVPWMVGAGHPAGAASYGLVGCDLHDLSGFQSDELSAVGPPKRILAPRDYQVFERFVSVAGGPSVAGAADPLLEVRRQLFDEPWVAVEGLVTSGDGAPLGSAVRASVVVSNDRGPLTHAVPDADGRFSVRVPAQPDGTAGPLVFDLESYGMPVASVRTGSGSSGSTDGAPVALRIPGAGALTLHTLVDGEPDTVQVFVHPAEGTEDAEGVTGALFGVGEPCAPLLGDPWGASPACNRLLVDGEATILVPPGLWDVYATAGPFASIARIAGVEVDSGTSQSLLFDLATLPDIAPPGTLSADFHVHGRASFDSAIPDHDRVRAFLAARVDVIAATDHDVVNDYADALVALDAEDRLRLLVGLETTGHVLFPLLEPQETLFPKVIGHFNFWPVPHDGDGPWRGAPWDELAEPGTLFTRVRDAGWPETGVIQLNHPWGGLQFGRDFAWPTAIGLDLTQPLPSSYDGTGQSLFLRTPDGARYANSDYDAQEVMNGTSNAAFEQYRAIWHYLLNEGVVRAGTANSDSHSMTDNVLGTPRNLVFTDQTLERFDEAAFDADVRDGRIIGTNGPVIEIDTLDAQGASRTPSVHVFTPDEGADLHIVVRAAPWVPVDEVRILVNGALNRTLIGLEVPADPFGADGVLRLDTTLPLADLLPPTGDAWIVVEAGAHLIDNVDLDCDGVPDTGDNNGDHAVTWEDVEDLTEDPGEDCFETVGPLREPPLPAPGTPLFVYERVTPHGYPTGFTNPLLLDRDGGGYAGIGGGGR